MNDSTEQTLVERLRIRAEIRRNISSRKSVQNGERDRLSELLDEAADRIDALEGDLLDIERRKLEMVC